MVHSTAKRLIGNTNLIQGAATNQLEEALLWIEVKKSKEEIAGIILGLGGVIREITDNEKTTVANAVIKRLKSVKADVFKEKQASTMLNVLIDETCLVAVTKAGEAVASASNVESHDDKIMIQQVDAGSVSKEAARVTTKSQITLFIETVKIQQSGTERLKKRQKAKASGTAYLTSCEQL